VCPGAAVCGDDVYCGDCRPTLDPAATQAIGSTAIPVRRYGTIPLLAGDEPAWEIEPAASAPRTIADHGSAAVLLAGVIAALLGAVLLYLH